MKSEGVIERAVLAMLKARKKSLASGMPPAEEWSVRVEMMGEGGYTMFVKEQIFRKYEEKNATEAMIVQSLVSFIFGLIEEDLCEVQVRSTMVN